MSFFLQLEEVMETETYKNAKLILERFDPDSKRKNVSFFVLTSQHIYICLIVLHIKTGFCTLLFLM